MKQWKKASGEKNSEDPEVERGEPVQCKAARREGPEKFDAGSLANVECKMKKGGGERSEENGCARDLAFRGFGFAEEKGKCGE